MSIFKRFSNKKTGDNGSESEFPLLDESASLVEDSIKLAIPASAEDATPSLKGFSTEEQDVIRSILQDEPTSRSNFHKTNRKTERATAERLEPQKTADDYLSDESFKTAINLLKGDLDIDTGFDEPTLPIAHLDDPAINSESLTVEASKETALEAETSDASFATVSEPEVDISVEDMLEAEIEETTEDASLLQSELKYPERLTARATFHPVSDAKPEKIKEINKPEVELKPESASIESLVSGDEDMTSRDDNENYRDETYELRRQADQRHDDVLHAQRRVNLGEMRMDVANIVSDFENGESMYRRAQQRVENLTNYIERAEVDFSLLDRLEPENRALKSENIALQSELDKRKTRISQLTNGLEDLQRRFGDAQSELDATHSKLAQSIKNFERADRDISDLNAQLQEARLKSDRMRNDLEVENRENSNLRSRIADITTQLDKVTSEKLNYAKQIETLKIDVADQSENRLQLRDEVTELRHSLEDAQRQNTQMRGEITGVHDDIRGFKTQYEFNILKRDERITDLESQIVELNERLRMKEDQFESINRELSALRKERTAQDLERERLEKSVEQANSQLYRTEEELLKSRKAADELDMKYRDISDAFARSEERRQSSVPAATPDIAPPPFQNEARHIETDDIAIAPRSQAPELPKADAPLMPSPPVETVPVPPAPSPLADGAPSAERIAPTRQITDDIEDMLTDYKLGIRNTG